MIRRFGETGWGDNLCIGCVEKRLDRRIELWGDVINFQASVKPMSVRLLVRLLGWAITKRKPYRLRKGAPFGGFSAKTIAAVASYPQPKP